MTSLAKGIVLQISLAALALAQQRAKPRTHIICTPPNLKIAKMVRPVFPPAAKTKHVFGKVAVRAEIDKTGAPSKVTVLNGDPDLAAAVMEAVKQWRWKPLRLNGVPVEVESTITVNIEPR